MMKKWIRLFLSLVGSIMALVMAHFCNIFNYISYIPQDKRYDVCIAVYFTLFETFIDIIFTWILECIDKIRTKVEVVMYLPSEVPNANTTPIVRFNDMGMAELRVQLSVIGNCKNVLSSEIVMKSIIQADMQFARRGTGSSIDENGNAIINLNDIVHNRDTIQFEEDYKIVLQRGAIDNGVEIYLKPQINKHKKISIVKFVTNGAKLVLEEN